MKNRFKYHLYDANNKLFYECKFDYESQAFAERVGELHLKCFQIAGDLIGGYLEWSEI